MTTKQKLHRLVFCDAEEIRTRKLSFGLSLILDVFRVEERTKNEGVVRCLTRIELTLIFFTSLVPLRHA